VRRDRPCATIRSVVIAGAQVRILAGEPTGTRTDMEDRPPRVIVVMILPAPSIPPPHASYAHRRDAACVVGGCPRVDRILRCQGSAVTR